MKLLYCGGSSCDEGTFKRLLIVAEKIAFMDHSGTMFGEAGEQWGSVGMASPMRQFVTAMASSPVPLSVFKTPSGVWATPLFERYLPIDLDAGDFRRVLLDGLQHDPVFADTLVQADGQYRSRSGREVVSALVADPALRHVPLADSDMGRMFQVEDTEGRRATLRFLITDASVEVTSALLVSEKTGLLPVTDDPVWSHLIALRTSRPYVEGTVAHAPLLGLAVARAVIPDQALQHLTISDVIAYRESAKDAYAGWSTELNSLATRLDDVQPADLDTTVACIIASEVAPKLREYENEMKSARDKLFGDLIKRVVTWEMPTLSIAYFMGMSLGHAALAFASGLAPAVPSVVDYLQKRADVQRKHAESYLIGLSRQTGRS